MEVCVHANPDGPLYSPQRSPENTAEQQIVELGVHERHGGSRQESRRVEISLTGFASCFLPPPPPVVY